MADASEQNGPPQNVKNGEAPHWVAIAALVISSLTTVWTIGWTIYWSTSLGEVTPLEPSGYAIVRGVDPSFEGEPKPGEGVGVGPWPSDHIVLPIEWKNSSGSSALVRDPVLVFSEVGQNEASTNGEIRFFLVGELPEISPTVLNNINEKPYTFTNTIALEPHSVSQTFLVFRVEDWDDENNCFRFHQGQKFSVTMEFRREPENWLLGIFYKVTGRSGIRTEDLVDKLTVLVTANWISPYGKGESVGWDFYSLLPGARATSNEPLAETTHKYYSETTKCS